MLVIGLTGSIGMGKSTTATMFSARGVPVHDADAAVHALYEGDAVAPLDAAFPGVAEAGRIDRARLADRVLDNPEALARLEAIVHPLVRAREIAFIAARRAERRRAVVLDVPLLLEAEQARLVDVVVVVTASAENQRRRVMARPGMTAPRFAAILGRQMADADKRRRAHFLVDTDNGRAAAERQVDAILRALAGAG